MKNNSELAEKLNTNNYQWRRTSFYLSSDEAKKCGQRKEANCFETYILIKKINGNWTATEKTKTIQSTFSWLKMNRKIANELAKVGYFQFFEDVLRTSSSGEIIPGTGTMMFAYFNELIQIGSDNN